VSILLGLLMSPHAEEWLRVIVQSLLVTVTLGCFGGSFYAGMLYGQYVFRRRRDNVLRK
jgi:hypothetical protein